MTYNRSAAPRPSAVGPDSTLLEKLFRKGDGGKDELMSLAKDYAENLCRVKANQLRNLLDLVIWVKTSHKGTNADELKPVSKGRLAVCRPRLAYMAARETNLRGLRDGLNNLLEKGDAFKTGGDVDRLYEFASAVVAYHKYFETTNNRTNN